MWERVEKANEYRVGIIPRDTVLGTGKYNATDLEAELTGLDPATEYKSKFYPFKISYWIKCEMLLIFCIVFVIAENTKKGLVSAKRMSQAMTLIPQLYRVTGQGESNDVGSLDVELKMKGARQEIDYAIEIGEFTKTYFHQ